MEFPGLQLLTLGKSRCLITDLREHKSTCFWCNDGKLSWPGWGRQVFQRWLRHLDLQVLSPTKIWSSTHITWVPDHTSELKVGIIVWPVIECPWEQQWWGILNWGPSEKIQDPWPQHVEMNVRSLLETWAYQQRSCFLGVNFGTTQYFVITPWTCWEFAVLIRGHLLQS